jgi:putative FmdB family regulatory protein
MPLYEYFCKKCHHEFEELQKMTDKPVKKCPHCGANQAQKKVSLSGFQLKGSGWYADGYAKTDGKKAPSEGSDSGKSDKSDKSDKPSTKSEKSPTKSDITTKNIAA